MKYLYQARSKEGKLETGSVEASSKESAALLLQKYNVFVTSIKEQAPLVFNTEDLSFLNKVAKRELAIFARQLAVMMQSRVPVTQSLKSLAVQTKNPSFRKKILKISQLIEEGNPLSDAFNSFPDVFDSFFVSLVKTGEASGKISEALFYISDHLEREYDIESQVKGAMIYPLFVICVLFTVISVVVFFVMPRLVDLLKETASEPPLFTKLMIGFYSFLFSYGWIIMAGVFFLGVFIFYYFSTKNGKKIYDRLSLKTPILGELLKKIFLIRFAENISTLIEAGLSINNALKITKDTVDNFTYKQALTETEARVSEGEKISNVLTKYPEIFPAFVIQMVQVGEETGKLDTNLMEIVNFYQKEVNRTVTTLTSLLEPILIIFLGLIVAFLSFSILEPLYGVLETI